MRLAIVSDVHGNLPALEAVVSALALERPDVTVHGGDLVTNGPRPAGVVDMVRELGWPGVLGNTDEALWAIPPGLPENVAAHFRLAAPATLRMIGPERTGWLRGHPLEWRAEGVALVHAAPGQLWRGVSAHAPDS
ncbi:MAG: metallophosphoesterase family protein, partial [Candidatus Dormibacterales bacterium]